MGDERGATMRGGRGGGWLGEMEEERERERVARDGYKREGQIERGADRERERNGESMCELSGERAILKFSAAELDSAATSG